LESIFSPKVTLEPWIWKLIEMYEPIRTPGPRLAAPFESLQLHNLAKAAIYARSPDSHRLSIQQAYQQICHDIPELHKGLEKVSDTALGLRGTHPKVLSLTAATKALARVQSAYSMLLTLALIFNSILRKWDSESYVLLQDSGAFCSSIIKVAEQALQHRPFGSSARPFCLITAWAVTDDPAKLLQIEALVAEYQSDFLSAAWMKMGLQLRQKLMMH
jgi:hypothetical protein